MVYFRRGRQWRFHGLKKPKIRQDWNKYNLYNISRMRQQNTATRTYFQQKWTAKASLRAYHAEQLSEKKWERLFDRRTPAVIPMDPKALAENDGSFFSAGRGSGKEVNPKLPNAEYNKLVPRPQPMPYMQMVFHPTERRLDTAIFRALFASSARQARQFVVHGHVKVNGKKMIYPGYMLNPGDMFQVDPEHVLEATGKELFDLKNNPMSRKRRAQEVRAETLKSIAALKRREEKAAKQAAYRQAKADGTLPRKQTPQSTPREEITKEDAEVEIDDPEDQLTAEEASISDADPAKETKKILLDLRTQAIDMEETPPKGLKVSAKQRQALRAFRKTLKSRISRASSVTPSALDDLQVEWQELSNRIVDQHPDDSASSTPTTPSGEAGAEKPPPASKQAAPRKIAPSPSAIQEEIKTLEAKVDEEVPFEPKNYMSAFAFIPRYLEVHHAICSAVYLRHPVVRPDLSEVPTPFHPESSQLAFNWYLRRR